MMPRRIRGEDLVEIVTTVEREEDAARIVRVLVEARHVACGSWGPVRSIYRWRGETVDEAELRVELKTTVDRAGAAESALRGMHPYAVPAILRLPVLHANEAYAAWVQAAVAPPDPEARDSAPGEPR